MKNCPTCQGSYPTSFAVCPQDGTALVELGAWCEGMVIRGKYRILAKIGQGGMGAVYKALHLAFEELRALKVMSPELMNDELFVKRFKHEAVITRKLQHPNAVRVDDIDESEDGRPFIVMEYIEGQSLKKLIQDQGPLAAPRVCAVIGQVASALAAAHAIGMVHRDIKPDNIVLIETAGGEQAKVLDFGIAKLKEARQGGTSGMTLTGTGVVVGTPQYMSPEQAMGKRGDELDGRSDIYSLGIVMYQMLTGELPFKADTTLAMLMAHMQTPPTPIGTLRPELQIPEPLANLVMKCLEKKRELRPPSAKALIEEIERTEKETAPVGTTRVAPPTVGISPEALRSFQSDATARAAASKPPGSTVPEVRPVTPPPSPPTPQPRPVASPAVPRPTPAPAAAPPSESRWGLWVSIAILLVGLSAGAWYLTSHRGLMSSTPRQDQTVPRVARPAHHVKSGNAPSSSQVGQGAGSSAQPGTAPAVPAANITGSSSTDSLSGNTGTPSGGSSTVLPGQVQPEQRAETTSTGEPSSPSAGDRGAEMRPSELRRARPARERNEIFKAIKIGDFFYEQGKYSRAIREYQKALDYDPSNPVLQDKIARARKAKAAEERVLR